MTKRHALLAVGLLVTLSACHKHWTFEWGTPNPSVQITTARPPQAEAKRGLSTVSRFALPPEAQRTLTLIERGGPFPDSRDGATFGNRSGLLPPSRSGLYREYTVPTPGAADRGGRRIVCALPTECYYSADHYASFQHIGP